MHNMIFQLSEEPINKEDFLQEVILYDNFVGSIADYVTSDVDRDEEIKSFVKSELEPYGVIYEPTEQSIIFIKDFKKNYFAERYEQFKKFFKEMTPEVFAGYSDTGILYRIKSTIEKEFETYIFIDDNYMTLDEFVREMEEGKKYYFGSAIDYHM